MLTALSAIPVGPNSLRATDGDVVVGYVLVTKTLIRKGLRESYSRAMQGRFWWG